VPGFHTTAEEIAAGIDLRGKRMVITGGHSGIGLETTRVLANAGAAVTVGVRNMQKARQNLSGLKNVRCLPLDLANPASVDAFADTIDAVDILINNAGIMAVPLMRDARGYEMQFATNHLGHFQLTARLWDTLRKAGGARIVTLSSFGHRFSGVDLADPNFNARPYDKWAAYGQSKTANALFSVELDRRGEPHGVRAFAVHPGRIIATDLIRNLTDDEIPKSVTGIKTIQEGAATTVWCAISPQLEGKGGIYCADCTVSPITPNDSDLQTSVRQYAIDPTTAKALWDLSEKLL